MQKNGAYFHCWIIGSAVQEPSMNRLVLTLILSAFALGANAQSTAPDASAQVQNKSAEVTVVSGNADQSNDRNCLRETGSHIVSKNKKSCIDANGSSYSREDIDRTGTTDLADALRRLDPSVRVSHN
jgi:hypothetical protein